VNLKGLRRYAIITLVEDISKLLSNCHYCLIVIIRNGVEKMKKRSYLYLLISVMILSLLLPIVIFFNFFWKNAFEELERNNAIYYEEVLFNFKTSFVKKVQEMKLHASEIVADSRDRKSAFWEGTSLFEQNDYYRFVAVEYICDNFVHYDNPIGLEGIYFYDQGYLITDKHVISLEKYLQELCLTGDNKKTATYFERDNFENAKMIMIPLETENNSNGVILIGFCVRLGRIGQNQAMVIYKIDASDFLYESESLDLNFYVMDKDSYEIYFALDNSGDLNEIIDWENTQRNVGGIKQTVAYKMGDTVLNILFGIQVSGDSLQNSIFDFYNSMRLLVLIVTFLMLCICIGSIFVLYKPIYRLSSDLEDFSGGEIEAIQNALDERHLKIKEQEMLLYDLLLNNLIYGVPISEKAIRHLGVREEVRYYSVFMLEGHVLSNQEIRILSKEAEETYHIKIFVTGWQDKKSSVIILFLRENDISFVETWLNQCLQEYCADEYALFAGKVVDKMSDFRKSFLSCLELKNRNASDSQDAKSDIESFKAQDKYQKKLLEDILAYISIHYRETEFCQSTVADEFCITNYALSRMFKKRMGIGFTDYVNSKRIETAKVILLTTSKTVKEVSVEVGFLNQNYFSRLFKATVGISATDFRNK